MSEPTREPQDLIDQREWEKPANWAHWFGAYSSRQDSRLWVPKRPMTGTGWALNFAHPGAKTFLIGMGIVPATLLLVVIIALTR
jgi:uncharacterized membrane protein